VCDLRKEGCGQCSRAHLPCTGYRDTTAIRFENQTTAVEQKALRRTNATGLGVRAVNLSICHQAREIFYHDHVVGEGKNYSFLMQHYSPTAKDEYLHRSIDVVSLAYLSHQKHSPSARAEARRQYVDVLRLVRKALQSPESASKDSMLQSALLLDMYEKISNRKPQYDGAWASHIRGAFSLFRLDDDQQHPQLDRLCMLERLNTNILISCTISDTEIPNELLASQTIFTSPIKWMKFKFMVNFARLSRQVKFRLLNDDEIVGSAIKLDSQFLEIYSQLPHPGRPKTISVEAKSAHHYENYHYTYTNEHMGQMWNVFRITRILICEIIVSHCSQPLVNSTLDSEISILEYATAIISQLSREICATIPESLTKLADAKNHLPCYRLIFPLYIAAQSPTASEAMIQYAIQQLRFMADAYGIEGALIIAGILESGERTNPWEVYALLGSYAFVC
jgi:hypothetical protein